MKRLTLAQESLLERDRSLESLEHNYVDIELQLNRSLQEQTFREEDVTKLRQVRRKSLLQKGYLNAWFC